MAVDIFLKIEGPDLEGEFVASAHEKEIDVLAWSWGASQSGTMHIARGGGGGGGKVNVQDLSVTKWIDSASPNLFQHCAKGTQFAKATLTCRKASRDGAPIPYFVIIVEDVIISSVSTGGSGGEDRFTENLSLNFGTVTITYTAQDNDGTARPKIGPFGWDIQKNMAI